jgi:hypothetical protein
MAGKWRKFAKSVGFNASTMLLLTDGTVMVHDAGAAGDGTANWKKLTPDAKGNYLKGIWSPIHAGPNSPQFFASAVLRDGRVFVAGGEYNGSNVQVDLLAAEIYDPVADSWTVLPTPTGWTAIGDAICCVLPDGRVIIGSVGNPDSSTAIYDPVTNKWSAGPKKLGPSSDEESWVLLPDQTILTCNCFGHTNPANSEKYVIAANQWVSAGKTISDLVEDSSKEIGPAVLLADGRALFAGATGHTALYIMPPIASQLGTWADGPKFPKKGGQQLIAKDAAGCLLPNGRVLLAVSPAAGCPATDQGYCPPTYFYEFDPRTNKLHEVTRPHNHTQAVFNGRMLLLPTGQVLWSDGSDVLSIYTPTGTPHSSWRPVITGAPSVVKAGSTHTLHGQQLNGLSQASMYGDDATMATNYPIVRLRHGTNGKVVFARTHDFSTMGVATGTVVHSTRFTVPAGTPKGHYKLTVIANGIASQSHELRVN